MVIVPTGATPSTYPLTGLDIYSGIIKNTDGYTTELSEVTSDESAMPYVLVIDESDATTHQWNKFAMGASADFDVDFALTNGTSLRFDMFLTMGYGASAKRPQRLDPRYYNPEFNRKAAWKVNVILPQGENPPERGNTWDDVNSATPYNVTVEIYDWQTGASVATAPNFADADPSEVFAESEVESVTVEIPGMNNTPQVVTAETSGTGFPNSPLIYTVPIANENLLPIGEYVGLVKVQDTRTPLTPGDGRDFLIDSPDGIQLNNYIIPEYATYQTFIATVVNGVAPVGNVIIHVNRLIGTNCYYIIDSTPWSLDWDLAAGAVQYAIYCDNDPSDGLTNNPVYVDSTTSTYYIVPSSHFPSDRYVVGNTYVVRSRAIVNDPLSEAEDSEPVFITVNSWETLIEKSWPGWSNDGEGWHSNSEGSGSEYASRPYIDNGFSDCGLFNCELGVGVGSYFEDYGGRWNGIMKETPSVPNSSVRWLEMSSYIKDDYAPSGLIMGTCSETTPPHDGWNATDTIEWSSVSSTGGYYGYNSNSPDVVTAFSGVPAGINCWIDNVTPKYHLIGGDLNINGDPDDSLVVIEIVSLTTAVQNKSKSEVTPAL
jgi:hypothetical protein